MIPGSYENNHLYIKGIVCETVDFSHEVYGEKFYKTHIEVMRLSGYVDILPITISEKLINYENKQMGTVLNIFGQLRSYNFLHDGKSHLILVVFVKRLLKDFEMLERINYIELDGFLCKAPVFRTTPMGRSITDILLAVNRPYGKSDYIPCISWGRIAYNASELNIGQRVRIIGRLQSREYKKLIGKDEAITKVAYEVSISQLDLI